MTATTNPSTGEVTWTPGTPTTDTWFAWSMDRDGLGRIVREYTGNGAGFDSNPGVPAAGDTSHLPVGEGLAYDRQYTYTTRGQLATVMDRTVNTPVGPIDPGTTPADAPGLYCQARSYGFNTDGARTTSTVRQYTSGACTGTASATSTRTYSHDTANRFTKGVTIDSGTPGGAYSYDGLGRQTTVPASDAPNFGSAITLGYYVDDLPASVTQGGVSTSFTLDAVGRRSTQTVTGGWGNGQTMVRHYGDSGDNPAWSVTTPAGGAAQLTRYTDSISGDLGASITSTGDASIGIVDPHDNNVTTLTIPATQAGTVAAVCVNGWARWAEYGSPAAPTTVTGPLGYGWLGAKQRETSTDAAGLTLMGVRYYNWTTGTFTGPDPIPGGNHTSYGYPTDPINGQDPTGEAWRPGCNCIGNGGGYRYPPVDLGRNKSILDFIFGKKKKLTSNQIGALDEKAAAAWLRAKGYNIRTTHASPDASRKRIYDIQTGPRAYWEVKANSGRLNKSQKYWDNYYRTHPKWKLTIRCIRVTIDQYTGRASNIHEERC